MTADRQVESRLPGILADLGAGPAPVYADVVLARTAAARQRPAWRFASRWLRIDPGFPAELAYRMRPVISLAVVALLVAALIGVAVYVGSQPHVPAPFGLAGNGALTFGSSGDILSEDPSGSVQTIIGGSTYDFAPFYSPDGTRIAFLRRVDPAVLDGAADLVVARADGSDATVVTSTPLLEIPWSLAWKPDSSAIALLTSARLDGRLELFDVRRRGEPVVIDPGLHIDSFAFQPPSGDRIAFRGQSGFEIGLYTMRADGSDVRTLIQPYVPPEAPDIVSPDLYASVKTWGNIRTSPDLRNPAWSPDGSSLVVQQTIYPGGVDQSVLVQLAADGSDLRPITSGEGLLLDLYPTWSPDGHRIAFLRFDTQARDWNVMVLDRESGSVLRTGPSSPGGLIGLAWSPDGTSVLVIEHSGDRRTWLLDPAGGPARERAWVAESNGYWDQRNANNGLDPGSWQRKAAP